MWHTKASGCCWCSLPPPYTPEAVKPTPGKVQSPAEDGLACASYCHSIYSSRSLLLPNGASPQLQLTPPPVWVTLSPLTAGTCCHCPGALLRPPVLHLSPVHTGHYSGGWEATQVVLAAGPASLITSTNTGYPTPAGPNASKASVGLEEWAPDSVTGSDKAVPQPEGAGGRRSNGVARA